MKTSMQSTLSPRVLPGLLAAVLLSLSAGAQAGNFSFLRDTPLGAMSKADYDSITRAIQKAVAQKQDGEAATWNNTGLGNRVKVDATITPTTTQQQGNTTCRDTEVVLRARGESMTVRPQFCRQGTGAWTFQAKRRS